MVTFRCYTCGYLNTAADGQQIDECVKCGTSFRSQRPIQKSFQYAPSVSMSQKLAQILDNRYEPQEYIPKVPAHNRYAGHDEIIRKMVMDLVDQIFRKIEAKSWYPVTVDTKVADYDFTVWVGCERIHTAIQKNTCMVEFVNYGMASVPDVGAFKYAVEPFLLYYMEEKAKEKLGHIHRLLSYKVECCIHKDRASDTIIYFDFRVTETLHPDALKSW